MTVQARWFTTPSAGGMLRSTSAAAMKGALPIALVSSALCCLLDWHVSFVLKRQRSHTYFQLTFGCEFLDA